LSDRSARKVLAAALLALVGVPTVARADEPEKWVDRPFVLPPFHAGLGVGFANAGAPDGDGMRRGTGASFEAAFGTPVLAEIRLRTGFRNNDTARAVGADSDARLFDHETSNEGSNRWANPEIGVRYSFADYDGLAIGLETRFVVPLAEGTHFTVSPGLPLRIHVPGKVRIDTGVFMPFRYTEDAQWSLSVPVQVYFEMGRSFFGPMIGLRMRRVVSDDTRNLVDIPAGLGAGWTLFRGLDFQFQAYTRKLDGEWTKSLAFSSGATLTVP
jgi:hypothetical protein